MPKRLCLLPIACAALALGAGSAALGQEGNSRDALDGPSRAQATIDLLIEYCIAKEAYETKSEYLQSRNWEIGIEGPTTLDGEPLPRLDWYENSEWPEMAIMLIAPAGSPNTVRTCIVDGRGIPARELIQAATAQWGVPDIEDGVVVWADSLVGIQIEIGRSNAINTEENSDPDAAALVYFLPNEQTK